MAITPARPARPAGPRRVIAAVVLASGLAVGLAACGDDASGALTNEQFSERANAICRAGRASIDDHMASLGEQPTEDQLTAAAELIASTVAAEVAEMKDLGTPPDIAAAMEDVWDDVEDVIVDIRRQGSSVFAGPDPFEALRPRLRSLGLTDC